MATLLDLLPMLLASMPATALDDLLTAAVVEEAQLEEALAAAQARVALLVELRRGRPG